MSESLAFDPEDEVDDDRDREASPSARRQALHAQLIEHRDDPPSWAVYGDLLQLENDPRGALVTLMLERERAPTQKLFDSQQALLAQHGKRWLPRGLRRHFESVAWRRGFPVGIPVPSLGVLAQVIASPSLAFVESVRLQVLAPEWAEWTEALAGAALPWRRVRIELPYGSDDEELELAPWFASLPQLEHLQITCPDYHPDYQYARFGFAGAASARLRHLAFDRANELAGLEDADFPALETLRCLGTTPIGAIVFESELWGRLREVVITDPDAVPRDAEGPSVIAHVRPDEPDPYDYDYEEGGSGDAFIAIGKLVDAELIEELARGVKGPHALAVDVGHVVAGELTAVRLRGAGTTDLVPYGFAVTLASRLPPATPIALVHASDRTGVVRGFSLGTPPMRRSGPSGRGAEVLRALLDHQAGRDPGIDVFDDLKESLEHGHSATVFGSADRLAVLTDIDPGSLGPLPEIDEDFEVPVPEHEVELYTAPPELVPEVAEAAISEAPPLLDEVIEVEQELAEDTGGSDEIAETDDDGDDAELRTDAIPDGLQAWLRLLSEWAERERDPDGELVERFPDPELQWSEHVDIDTARAVTTCQTCGLSSIVSYPCTWCGGLHCPSCAVKPESGGVWCSQCIFDLANARAGDPGSPSAYNDDVYDAEVAEDVAEARAPIFDTAEHTRYDDDEWA